ncbi:hypothetical protein B5X24_HaOG215581 [Helicoverpa armigera]|uniref:Uncharacterized protein n=1 Tax=Helicoverpa armigera TaxID=29058 RepID=A0A2W1B034_HELAM|nr:hypothetical protein B5X24_HaOG215581 [Helicoverpa armigera]
MALEDSYVDITSQLVKQKVPNVNIESEKYCVLSITDWLDLTKNYNKTEKGYPSEIWASIIGSYVILAQTTWNAILR